MVLDTVLKGLLGFLSCPVGERRSVAMTTTVLPTLPATPSGASQAWVKRQPRWVELRGILACDHPAVALEAAKDEGWLEFYLPGIDELWRSRSGVSSDSPVDPWELTKAVAEAVRPLEVSFGYRLAALCFLADDAIKARLEAAAPEVGNGERVLTVPQLMHLGEQEHDEYELLVCYAKKRREFPAPNAKQRQDLRGSRCSGRSFKFYQIVTREAARLRVTGEQ
jgi:hypothetical protein